MKNTVFTLQSIKSRIETHSSSEDFFVLVTVFTLQSIKSRIETRNDFLHHPTGLEFLLYSPLNQGLKPISKSLKLRNVFGFLLYSPLNQGLKRAYQEPSKATDSVFTLQSIKSRIETWTFSWSIVMNLILFLLYSPLNQGLKQCIHTAKSTILATVFTLQSIKSRIETSSN